MLRACLSFFAFSALVYGRAIPRDDDTDDVAPVALSVSQANVFAPFANFAAAAYCDPDQILDLSCGGPCDAIASSFTPTASGGDGIDVQFWYVGFDSNLNSVIVGHQGTDPKKIVPLLTDADFFLEALDPTLFPGLSDDIQVHNGFHDAQASTAQDVLAAVQQTMSDHSTTSVIISGHSLGAAISVIDAVFLKLNLPSSTTFQLVTFGQPRVGNQAFADFFDATFPGLLTHINNQADFVPTIPGRFLGFVHPSGEVHIQDDGTLVSCSGQDDTADGCTLAEVPNILEGELSDHGGPYFGIHIGSSSCN